MHLPRKLQVRHQALGEVLALSGAIQLEWPNSQEEDTLDIMEVSVAGTIEEEEIIIEDTLALITDGDHIGPIGQ